LKKLALEDNLTKKKLMKNQKAQSRWIGLLIAFVTVFGSTLIYNGFRLYLFTNFLEETNQILAILEIKCCFL
jgi:hypothetical protein